MFNPIEYVRQLIKEYNEEIDTRPTSAMYDLVVTPLAILYNAIMNEIFYMYGARYLDNASDMPEEEVDLLMSNLFITRKDGGKASGSVYCYFSEPVDLIIPDGAIFETDSGTQYVSTEVVSITRGEMSVNIYYGLYYVSIPVESNGYGEEYNIPAEAITKCLYYIPSLTKVSNPLPITGGLNRETNEQLVERAKTAIVSRNLITKRSIDTLLMESFPYISDIDIVGFGDPEMTRDTQTVLVNGTEYDMNMGGCVDVYINTGPVEIRSAQHDNDRYIPASKTRAYGYTGEFTDNYTFSDPNADFIGASVKEDDLLVVYNNITMIELRILSVDGYGTVTLKDPSPNVASGIEYSIESSSNNINSLLAIKNAYLDSGGLIIQLYNGSGFYVNKSTIYESPKYFDSDIYGSSIVSVFSDGEKDYVNYFGSSMTPLLSSPIELSTASESNARITFLSPSVVAVVRKEGADTILAIVDIQNEAILSETTISSDDASYEYFNHDIVSRYDGTDYFVYVIDSRTNISAGVFDITVFEYSVDVSSGALTQILNDYNIGSSFNASSCLRLRASNNSDHITIASQESLSSVSITTINNDALLAGPVIPVSSTRNVNNIDIAIDDNDNVVMIKTENNSFILYYKFKIQEVGSSSDTLVSSLNVISDIGVSFDSSGMIHLGYIDTNNNSGDIRYIKYDENLNRLVTDDIVYDQYRNSSEVMVLVDENRRPCIMWNSFDLYGSNIDGCIKNRQDYSVKSIDENKRYSVREIVSIVLDPAVSSGSEVLNIDYYYQTGLDAISSMVADRGSVDRVVTSNYLVKSHIPCVVDMKVEYTGNRNDIADSISDYINNMTDSTLYASEIISALDLSNEEKITVPFEIVGRLNNSDGTVDTIRSMDSLSMNRIVRFMPGNIEVVRV